MVAIFQVNFSLPIEGFLRPGSLGKDPQWQFMVDASGILVYVTCKVMPRNVPARIEVPNGVKL